MNNAKHKNIEEQVTKKGEIAMRDITLTHYSSMEEFIEAVDNADTWDATPSEDYREALARVFLEYDWFDDPDEMWSVFLAHYDACRHADELLKQLAEKERDGHSHAAEFFSDIYNDLTVGNFMAYLWAKKDIEALTNYIVLRESC